MRSLAAGEGEDVGVVGDGQLVVEVALGQDDTDRAVGVTAADAVATGDDREVAVEVGASRSSSSASDDTIARRRLASGPTG